MAHTTLHQEVIKANETYADAFGAKKDLALPPARKAAFLVCMDARLDPAKFAGLSEGDAHVIRNAGGRASDDAVRSFVISHKLLGTNEWFIVHHTDCGMEYFTSVELGELLKTSLATAAFDTESMAFKNVTQEGGDVSGTFINWLTIKNVGQAQSITEDVERVARHPLVAPGIPIHGYLYDVKTGKLGHVYSATSSAKVSSAVGKA